MRYPWVLLAGQPPRLDRQGLLGHLKRGASIPGAELSNPKCVLTVRQTPQSGRSPQSLWPPLTTGSRLACKARPAQRGSSARNGPWVLRSNTGRTNLQREHIECFCRDLETGDVQGRRHRTPLRPLGGKYRNAANFAPSSDERPGIVGHLRTCAITSSRARTANTPVTKPTGMQFHAKRSTTPQRK